MQKRNMFIMWILIIWVSAMPLFAQGLSDNMTIHGSISRGYLKTSGNNYLAEDSKEGCLAYGEAVLNFTVTPMEKLRIGMQLYGRDLDAEGNFYVVVDYAYGDYHLNDLLGIRMGRFKNPMGLYGKVRDVDMARVPVFLPQSVYSEGERDMNLAIDGVGIYGNINTGSFGDFEYEAVYGSYNIYDDQGVFFKKQYSRTSKGIVAGIAQTPGLISADLLGTSNEASSIENVWDITAVWNTPLNGLKVGTSISELDFLWDFNANVQMVVPTGDPTNPTFAMVQDVPVEGDYSISTNAYYGEWQLGNLTLAGEFRKFLIEGIATVSGSANKSVTPREMYYGMASYRLNDWLAFSSYYSVFHANTDDKDGAIQVANGSPDYSTWQKDICFSARVDIVQNWIMKLEYHSFDGTGQVNEIFNPEGSKRNWGMLAVKSTFHF